MARGGAQGRISYREMCAALTPDSYQTESDQHFSTESTAAHSAEADPLYRQRVLRVQEDADRAARVEEVIAAFTRSFFSKRRELRQTFRLFDHDGSGSVGRDEFCKALSAGSVHISVDAAGFHLGDDEIRILADHYFASDHNADGMLDYAEFFDTLWGDEKRLAMPLF